MLDDGITRRTVLRSVAAGGATVATGAAAAEKGPTARIVGTASPRAERAAKARAESVKRVLDFGDVGKAVAGKFTDEAADNLSRRPDVRYVEADGTMEALTETLPWGVDRVDADVLHGNGETGSGADIAIIDTGIDDDHPDLQANVGSGKAFTGCRGPNCNHEWSDDNDHGTHCAGIADAVDNSEGVVGVSTEATLHAVKVLDKRGSGSYSDIAAGIEYVADQGWDVGSMSLGGPSGAQTLRDACQYAVDNGVLLVAAAGNSGPCTDCVGYPAAYETVMAVSSTSSSDELSNFSSTGPEVEIAAPGSSVYSTVVGGYDTFSGTSMACPHVAGAAGQLMANGYTNTDARDRLSLTAEDVGLSGNESGAGLLDVEAAMGGSSDSAPSVSWVTPSDGETVSGTVTVQIEASDTEDDVGSLNVDWILGSASRDTTYDSGDGYYEDSWDTTGTGDDSYDITAEAIDSAGNTTTTTITVSVDNTESAPAVDSLSAAEVETGDGDAEFDVDWSVSDPDGDLSSVDLVLTQDSDGSTEDTTGPMTVSGNSDSGTTRLVAADDDGSGNSYTIDVTATDSYGNTDSDSTTVSETEETSTALTIDSFSVSPRTTGPWFRAESDWSVSDSDGDLASVTTELLDSGGNVLDSTSSGVSGSSASGTHEVRTRGDGSSSVKLTVTDTAGNSTSGTRSV